MRLAMRLPSKRGDDGGHGGGDPREGQSAEVIDLASRNGFSAVAERKTKTEGVGLALGAVMVLLLGGVTWWAMEAAQLPEEGTGPAAPAQAATQPAVVPSPQPAQAVPPVPQPDPAPAPVLARPPGGAVAPATNPYASPTMVFDASAASRPAQAAEAAAATAPGATSEGAGAGGSAAQFASRIGGVGGAPAQARPMTNPGTNGYGRDDYSCRPRNCDQHRYSRLCSRDCEPGCAEL